MQAAQSVCDCVKDRRAYLLISLKPSSFWVQKNSQASSSYLRDFYSRMSYTVQREWDVKMLWMWPGVSSLVSQ